MKKCVIITSIHPFTQTSIQFWVASGWDVIVAGDKKTPHEYERIEGIQYLGIDTQRRQYSSLSDAIPFNSYPRKNFGYLYAIQNGYDLIFDTDDDNYPVENWAAVIQPGPEQHCDIIEGPRVPNILALYTSQPVWPRGFPLELINQQQPVHKRRYTEPSRVYVWQGLAAGTPDVDAIFRLTTQNSAAEFQFVGDHYYACAEKVYTPGNTQATAWNAPPVFHLQYLPVTVSFRFCDILKMYVMQRCLWEYGGLFGYMPTVVEHKRNWHNLMEDFILEIEMYKNVYHLIDILDDQKLAGNREDLYKVYERLVQEDIVQAGELRTVEAWLRAIEI